jgi:dimethylaniline monooxygenase (N-oxide forming)
MYSHSIHSFPGANRFLGRVLHAKEYTDFRGFEDKRIFLVGIGNSSLDIAVELAKVARSVTISTRRGAWIFNRLVQVHQF